MVPSERAKTTVAEVAKRESTFATASTTSAHYEKERDPRPNATQGPKPHSADPSRTSKLATDSFQSLTKVHTYSGAEGS